MILVDINRYEGYGRFHFLDRIKFCYNARGSLIEAIDHWLELMEKRGKVEAVDYKHLSTNIDFSEY